MTILSLRTTIGTLSAVVVLIVTAITMSITLSVSFAALRAIGTTHAAALADVARVQAFDYLGGYEQITNLIVNETLSDALQAPLEEPRSMARYNALRTDLTRLSNFIPAMIGTWFIDGTRYFIQPDPADANLAINHVLQPDLAAPADPWNNTAFYYTKSDRKYVKETTFVSPDPDTRAPGGFLDQMGFVTGGTTKIWLGIFISTFLFADGSKITTYYAPLIAPLINTTGGAPMGYSFINVRLEDLANFLQGLGTPNTVAIIVNANDGQLVATSHKTLPYFNTTEEPIGTETPAGCQSTGDVVAAADSTVTIGCRHAARDYAYAPIAAAALDDSLIYAQNQTVRFMEVDGENYYVAADKIPLTFPGLSLHLVLAMPEVDVIGDIVAGRNRAIIWAAVCFVVAAVASFIAIWLLLRPLEDVAHRMYKAAELDDDSTDESYSVMHEIFELQDAYYTMNNELNRIRSFVPQSVLMAKAAEHEAIEAGTVGKSSAGGRTSLRGSQRTSLRASQRASQRPSSKDTHSSIGMRDALGCSLRSGDVSVLHINLRGFHAATAALDHDKVLRAYEATLTMVLQALTDNKGVLDTFQGDHFIATFNAVKPAAGHGRRAVIAALRIRAGLATAEGRGFKLRMTSGVALGRALIGNVGNKEMKRFIVVGPAVTQAAVLERMCKLYRGVSCLVPQRLLTDLQAHVEVRAVDIIKLPFVDKPIVISAAVSETAAAGNDDEWLYVVDRAEKGDSNAAANATFTLLQQSNYAAAVARFDESRVTGTTSKPAPEENETAEAAPHIASKGDVAASVTDTLSALIDKVRGDNAEPGVRTEFGRYFNAFTTSPISTAIESRRSSAANVVQPK